LGHFAESLSYLQKSEARFKDSELWPVWMAECFFAIKQNAAAFKREMKEARSIAILGDEEMVTALENQPDFLKHILELQAAKTKEDETVAPIRILVERDGLKNRMKSLVGRLGVSIDKDLLDLESAPEIFGDNRAIELDALHTYGIDFLRDVVLISAGAQPRSTERKLQAIFESLRKADRFGIFRLDAIDVMARLVKQSA
jgi:hypothetical protein